MTPCSEKRHNFEMERSQLAEAKGGGAVATLTQEDRDHIQTIVEETWVKASLSSDWDTVTALFTEDIDYMPADHSLGPRQK